MPNSVGGRPVTRSLFAVQKEATFRDPIKIDGQEINIAEITAGAANTGAAYHTDATKIFKTYEDLTTTAAIDKDATTAVAINGDVTTAAVITKESTAATEVSKDATTAATNKDATKTVNSHSIAAATAVNNDADSKTAAATNINVVEHTLDPSKKLEISETDLDRKIAILQKEQELLLLQKSVANLRRECQETNYDSAVGSIWSNMSSRLTFRDIEHTITKFDGENRAYSVHDFIRNCERVVQMVNADDIFRYTCLCNTITGDAKLLLTRDVLLITEFGRVVSRNEVYKALANHKWDKECSVRRYVLEMENIAARCDYVDEFELINFIVEGLQDNSPEAYLLMNARTMKDFKESLDLYERRRSCRLYNREAATKSKPTKSSTPKPEEAEVAEVRCFNCTRMGHFQSKCHTRKGLMEAAFVAGRWAMTTESAPIRRRI
ncbi:PREDICTED: uncharacterized protein LOC108361849 [Rhagoletis zephyria]|uniref:uncharacterized protein LOC108361849 n=1 Tax=Rhagoletis zephyria TaxID=28612 RepID=UPI0008119ADC|nr:PREDICTED: uncharacterized protein LOC108361849 [Rhagoletis zephyria]